MGKVWCHAGCVAGGGLSLCLAEHGNQQERCAWL